MSRQTLPAQKGAGLRLAVAALAVVALLAFAYLGTGLSTGVRSYTTTDTALVGVVFNIEVENDGLFGQEREVRCEVKTTQGSYQTVRTIAVESGERVETTVLVAIPLLDPRDIVEKRCYTPLL